MDNGAEKMIAVLSPEIEKKCSALKEERKMKIYSRLFMLMCFFAIVIPTLFVLFGFSLTLLIVPVIFMGIAFLLLSPILIHQQGGRTYEQA